MLYIAITGLSIKWPHQPLNCNTPTYKKSHRFFRFVKIRLVRFSNPNPKQPTSPKPTPIQRFKYSYLPFLKYETFIIRLLTYLLIYLFTHLFAHPFVYPSSIHPSPIHPSIHSSIYLLTNLIYLKT